MVSRLLPAIIKFLTIQSVRYFFKTPTALSCNMHVIIYKSEMMSPGIFTGNSTTFFKLGKRDIGLWLLGEAENVTPGSRAKLINEGQNNE